MNILNMSKDVYHQYKAMYLGPKNKSEKIGFKFSYPVIIVQLIIVTLSAKSSLILVENKAGFPRDSHIMSSI